MLVHTMYGWYKARLKLLFMMRFYTKVCLYCPFMLNLQVKPSRKRCRNQTKQDRRNTTISWIRLDQCGSDWTSVDQTGAVWIRLDQCGSDWSSLDQTGPVWIRLEQSGSNWTSVDQTGAVWIRLDPLSPRFLLSEKGGNERKDK